MYLRKLKRCRQLYDDWYRGNLLSHSVSFRTRAS